MALRGTPEQTAAAAKEFKVFFAKVAWQDAGQLHDGPHGRIVRARPSGRVRLFVRYGGDKAALTDDLKALLRTAG